MKITDFTKTSKYEDDDLELFSITANNKTLNRGMYKRDTICVIPFDMNSKNQISNIYLAKNYDFSNGENLYSCITEDFDASRDGDSYDTFMRSLNMDLGLSDVAVPADSCYYLGKVCHTIPAHKNYHCYAIDVTNLATDPKGFTPKIPQEELDSKLYSIDKVRFNRVVKGEISDSLTLAGTLLLISYLS